MGLNKKIYAGILTLAVMGGMTGCISAPYEQDIPVTTYTVDENGKRVKVQENGKVSESSRVASAADAFYNSIFEGTTMKEMEALQETAAKKAKEKGLSLEEDLPLDFEYELYTTSGLSYAELSYMSDPAKMDKQKYVDNLEASMLVSYMGEGKMSIKFAPSSVVMVDDTHATIDFNKSTLRNTETGETTQMPEGEERRFQFVKVDGQWLFDMDDFITKYTGESGIAPLNQM
ncbi:MAG: hypothetical protein H9W81_04300 [Enterococcus sp.]|nr:hypothetical protein [Enterococcus sp.]